MDNDVPPGVIGAAIRCVRRATDAVYRLRLKVQAHTRRLNGDDRG
jgi:hypothetical protein